MFFSGCQFVFRPSTLQVEEQWAGNVHGITNGVSSIEAARRIAEQRLAERGGGKIAMISNGGVYRFVLNGTNR